MWFRRKKKQGDLRQDWEFQIHLLVLDVDSVFDGPLASTEKDREQLKGQLYALHNLASRMDRKDLKSIIMKVLSRRFSRKG